MMQTQAVYDFLNAYPNDEEFTRQFRALGDECADSPEAYARGITALAIQKGADLPEGLVTQWLNEAFASYDTWIAERDDLSEDELDLVSGGSGVVGGTYQCAAGLQCRSCCPGSRCVSCICPILGPC